MATTDAQLRAKIRTLMASGDLPDEKSTLHRARNGFEMITTRPNAVTFSIRHVLTRAAQHLGIVGQLPRA